MTSEVVLYLFVKRVSACSQTLLLHSYQAFGLVSQGDRLQLLKHGFRLFLAFHLHTIPTTATIASSIQDTVVCGPPQAGKLRAQVTLQIPQMPKSAAEPRLI